MRAGAPLGWRAVGGSVAGLLHVRDERGCDDAHGWRLADGQAIVAVADGAGSRPGTSALGAHVAVEAVLGVTGDAGFRRRFADHPAPAVAALFEAALAAVETAAASLGVDPGLLATTLCVAVIGETDVVVGQIGDGIAAVERPDGAAQAVAVADRFEYANETVFLTTPQALTDHLKVHHVPAEDVRGLALTTDGLRYKVLDDVTGGVLYQQFYADTWQWARGGEAASAAIEGFLASVDDQTGDDKTLVVLVRGFDGEVAEPVRLSPRPEVTYGIGTGATHD